MPALGVDEDHIGAFHTRNGAVVDPENVVDTATWRSRHEWRIRRDRLTGLRPDDAAALYLCGSAANESDVWDLFDAVVALVVDDDTLRERLAARTGNNFGKAEDELALALGWNRTYEADLRACGAIVIDATRAISDVVDELLDRTTTAG